MNETTIEPPPGAPVSNGPAAGRERHEPLELPDVAILAYLGGLLVLWSPNLSGGFVTPRVVLALLGLGPGLVVLTSAAREGDRAARFGLGYLAWALLAALACAQPRIAVLGSFDSDLGWIHLASWIAAWGLGRRLGAPGRRLLPAVLVGGVLANALVAVLQVVAEPTGALALVDGRATGLVSSSVFLGGLMAGGLALLGRSIGASRRWPALLVAVVLTSAAADLSGSRVALVGGAGACLLAVVGGAQRVARREVALRVGLVALALAVGALAGSALDSGSSSTGRLAGGGGVDARVEMWGHGLRAAVERPVLGWGPGRFRAATAGRASAAFVRAEGPDRPFYDAHNLLVEHLVGTGVPGLLLLGAFGWSAARRARGPAAWFAAGVALTWLLTPASVATAPAALVALGAAAPAGPAARGRAGSRVGLAVGAGLALVAAVAGARLVLADVVVADATEAVDPSGIQRAAGLLPPDAVLAGLETQAWRVDATTGGGPASGRRALAAARRAVELDPTRAGWWVELGEVQLAYAPGGPTARLAAADASFDEALARTPWSVQAMIGKARVAEIRGDDAAVDRWRERICGVVAGCGEAGG